MDFFKKQNLIWGWLTFAAAALTYILSMEPTTSLWDCAEFTATSYKLEVGHPPGAPLFMMITRLFTMLAPSSEYVGVMANLMSSLCSAFCILFLFWTITHLARRIYEKQGKELSGGRVIAIMGAGLVGSLAYTFSDTFWFSAIESEVYAMSSLFTAVVVWAMLRWEEVADKPGANRWLILIAYLMGLSTGVHILNLLAIPALVFIYYFRKTPKVTKWGVVLTTLVSGVMLVGINYIIIPYSVVVGAFVDRMFVNGLGLPVNSGITFYVFALFALCAWGVWYTFKKNKVIANTLIMCVTVILLGYGSYASVVIRAAANPPMNSNNPSNPYALLQLLNRDQYGDRPLLTGPYYSSPPEDYKQKTAYYLDNGKYKKMTYISGLKYPDQFTFFFPRMYSNRGTHPQDYSTIVNIKGRKIPYFNQATGEKEMITVPTFGENLRYFFNYQLGTMYWRYFMWNFVGRQSDIQSTGEITDGNWLSGINFIDALYLGPQDNIPSEMAANKGRNTYFFLPFILGIIGLVYQLNRDKRNFVVVLWLFVMMGVALVIYFNTSPGEPRERDYVYAGSFYAFAIWIGFAVMWLYDLLAKARKKESVAVAAVVTAVLVLVPLQMLSQNWDDHNRSRRYTTLDLGWNYLQSALPNSIVMNYGDNDTFPLWYNQEVMEVRPDIRIMNMSYLGADWYIDEMKLSYNESKPVPFSLPRSKYVNTNDYVFVINSVDTPVEIKKAMDFLASDNPGTKKTLNDGQVVDYLPVTTLLIPVDRNNAVEAGIIRPEEAHLAVDTMQITITKRTVDKSELMLLDLLANFDWKRPLYFTQTHSLAQLGLREWLQFDGYAYRLVPFKTEYTSPIEVGRIDTDYLYDKMMNTFRFGNIADPRVYADSFIQINHNAAQSRNGFARLASALVDQGENEKAIEVLDYAVAQIPFNQIRHSYTLTLPIIEAYYKAGDVEKGDAILQEYANILQEYINYYMRFTGRRREHVEYALEEKISLLGALYHVALRNDRLNQTKNLDAYFNSIGIRE